MDIIEYSTRRPVTVVVGVILVVLFGIIGLLSLPYQLTPDVSNPEITVRTTWAGATPYEVEREIIQRQEDKLKGLRGLRLMESHSYNGFGEIVLTFSLDTDLDDALLRTSNKMNEVSNYPENVEKPVILATGASSSPVIWLTLKTLPGDHREINTYLTYFKDEIRQHLDRVPGVGDLFIFGGQETEIHVGVDPRDLAAHRLTISQVAERIRGGNVNTSAGLMDVGKKSYRVRTVAEYKTLNDLSRLVLFSDGTRTLTLGDVAQVGVGYQVLHDSVMQNSKPVIAIGIKKEPGANVLALTDQVRSVVKRLNAHTLKEHGLYLDWVYDQTPYIRSAIGLVKKNILIGGILAVLVLFVFLRSLAPTLVVATAIPISAIGTFIFMWLMGRNLNVVSLAGISFAVGMLVDNSIVVLENIDRHRGMGKDPFNAAYQGTREVWGAVLASTATTVAVFLPVIFLKEEAGQLFKDIAIAITFSVSLSLIVSVTVIPMLSSRLFLLQERWAGKGRKRRDPLASVGEQGHRALMSIAKLTTSNLYTRLATVVLFTLMSVVISMALLPKMEYLPQGNRNLVMGILIPPPGYSYAERRQMGDFIFKVTRPYFSRGRDGIPKLENVFFVASERFTLFGGVAANPTRAKEMIPLFWRIVHSIPGVFGVVQQMGIFESRIGKGRTVDVDIMGDNLDSLVQTSRAMYGMIKKEIPGSQIRPIPSFELSYPEADFLPNRRSLIANGLNSKELGVAIDVLMDGRKVDEFKREGRTSIDIVLTSKEGIVKSPEDLLHTMVSTPRGRLVSIGTLSQLVYRQGLTEIYHQERKRAFQLQVTPPPSVPLQSAMETIRSKVVAPLKASGMLKGLTVFLGGVADKLVQARKALQWNFLLAVIITYLLMAALFENFLYPFIIMFSVPLAAAGGFIGLKLVNIFIAPQPLDILTMLGFVILVGVVVNNAILIVHQALNNMRDGMERREAVMDSTRTRIRPIFMSVTTTLFGMLPLVVAPGSGSELYRGLGSVVLGGLAVSTLFTLFLIPAIMLLFTGKEREERS